MPARYLMVCFIGLVDLSSLVTIPPGMDHSIRTDGSKASVMWIPSMYSLQRRFPWAKSRLKLPSEFALDQHGVSGRQYPTEVGYIDFLCKDRSDGAFVVIELKRGRTSDVVVGQTQRYMGWVKRNLESSAPVYGLIIANEIDNKPHYALDVATNISARQYRVQFELVEPEADFAR